MKHLLTLIILFALITLTAVINAQPPGLPGGPEQAPIDGGLGVLAAFGGGYALKKLRDRNRRK